MLPTMQVLPGWIALVICIHVGAVQSMTVPWPPKEAYFKQDLDHFSFQSKNLTFNMRYLYEDRWYKPGGPIFFYCGNEGSIESFWNNTGFVFNLASTMKAMVVFAEHDYEMVNVNCPARIREAYKQADKLFHQGSSGLKRLSKTLRLCEPIRSTAEYKWMLKWTRNAMVMMAMMDYPVKASFMADLPAYPINVSCVNLLKAPDALTALRETVAVFYNGTQDLKCYDYKKQFIECADITGCGLGYDSFAWDFQSCTEMNLFDPSNTTSADMFPSLPLTKEAVTRYCQARWGVTPAFNQLATFYGPGIWKTASNIVFSNGNFDPWMKGGILENLSPTVRAVLIDGGAHHLDLRSPDPTDPPSVRTARQIEANMINDWINREYL